MTKRLALLALVVSLPGGCASTQPRPEGNAKLSQAAAEKLALTRAPGGATKESELEQEHGRLVWSFDIATPGTPDITEVQVDAVTGEIVSVEKESSVSSASTASSAPSAPAAPPKKLGVREQVLLAAALAEDWAKVRRLADAGADVNAAEPSGMSVLHYAITGAKGDASTVQYLIGKGANVAVLRPDGSTLLHQAGWANQPEIVTLLAARGVPVNVRSSDGKSALQLAAGNDAWEAVRALLRAGADASDLARDAGFTPLHVAALLGDGARIRQLLASGANREAKTRRGETALALAADAGSLDAARALVEAGADVNAKDQYEDPVIAHAAIGGEVGVLELLVSHGAALKATVGPFAESLLYAAAEAGRLAAVEYLVGKGLDVNGTRRGGEPMILAAASNAQWEVVAALARHGANVRVGTAVVHMTDGGGVQGGGETPLHLAARARQLELVKLLVAKGADVNAARDPKGMGPGTTVLHYAAQGGDVGVLDLLLSKGAKLTPNRAGETALHYAAWRGGTDAVRLLLGKGLDVNARTTDGGYTPIHYAAESGDVRRLELLVGQGARLDDRDDGGETLLHEAASNGRLELVDWLLGKGLDVHAVDRSGQTPRDAAAAAGHLDVVERLEAAAAKTKK